MATPTRYVCTLSREQFEQLRELLISRGWKLGTAPYAHWQAQLDKTTVVAYESGKLTVQGKGTAELVQFVIEPEYLGAARFGYETELAEVEKPDMFTPHAGIDESGKGDYFGPLVIAAAYVDATTARTLLQAGVADSKTIHSDRRIADLADTIRRETRGAFSVVAIGPEAYNRLYAKFRNVNSLLAWGHARALENLLEIVPDCPRAISDQFGGARTIPAALLEKGRKVKFEQRHRAEADIAVAAASVLARAGFVHRLEELGKQIGLTLPKGAGPQVDKAAAVLAARGGRGLLASVAKSHFRTTEKVISGAGTSPDSSPQTTD
ncbi:MAG: ribonuclease HIII [Lentisphaerae bacterium RIFOXYA12_64_32]|nr:MAG: ribonuclease HIII [Lentisphaerae bacterium RIFOXYA12_64_32]